MIESNFLLRATVRIESSSGEKLVRHVNGGTGQGGPDSLVPHFGLGETDSIERILPLPKKGNYAS